MKKSWLVEYYRFLGYRLTPTLAQNMRLLHRCAMQLHARPITAMRFFVIYPPYMHCLMRSSTTATIPMLITEPTTYRGHTSVLHPRRLFKGQPQIQRVIVVDSRILIICCRQRLNKSRTPSLQSQGIIFNHRNPPCSRILTSWKPVGVFKDGFLPITLLLRPSS